MIKTAGLKLKSVELWKAQHMVKMDLFTETCYDCSLKEQDVLIRKEALLYTIGALPEGTNIWKSDVL